MFFGMWCFQEIHVPLFPRDGMCWWLAGAGKVELPLCSPRDAPGAGSTSGQEAPAGFAELDPISRWLSTGRRVAGCSFPSLGAAQALGFSGSVTHNLIPLHPTAAALLQRSGCKFQLDPGGFVPGDWDGAEGVRCALKSSGFGARGLGWGWFVLPGEERKDGALKTLLGLLPSGCSRSQHPSHPSPVLGCAAPLCPASCAACGPSGMRERQE